MLFLASNTLQRTNYRKIVEGQLLAFSCCIRKIVIQQSLVIQQRFFINLTCLFVVLKMLYFAIVIIVLFFKFQPPSTDSVPELSSPPVLTATGGVVPMLGEVQHPPPGLPIPQYNLGEYIGPHGWPGNIIVQQPLEVCRFKDQFILLLQH